MTVEKVLTGAETAAEAAALARIEVIPAYPITPQTVIVESLAEMIGRGDLDARYINVESEHSAMASCIGAAAAGARTFTATSSQGLALMHEVLHYAANGRMPIVMVKRQPIPGPALESVLRPVRLPGPTGYRLDSILLRRLPGCSGFHHRGL